MKKIEKTAKSVNDALVLAAKELGLEKENLEYEVINEVGKGLMGLLVGKEVTISAWEKSAGIVESKEYRAEAPKKERFVKQEKPAKEQVKSVKEQEQPAKEQAKPLKEQAKPVKEVAEKDVSGLAQDVEKFLGELLSRMGIQATFEIKAAGERIDVDISGEKMGLLIGKRGDTLDAVQYLTMLYVNKGKQGYIKVNLDTEHYRSKREETLVRLAHGLEGRVLRFGRSITLEPMSPYERRIIHATLQENSKLKTYSVGDEPNRKVVVALK